MYFLNSGFWVKLTHETTAKAPKIANTIRNALLLELASITRKVQAKMTVKLSNIGLTQKFTVPMQLSSTPQIAPETFVLFKWGKQDSEIGSVLSFTSAATAANNVMKFSNTLSEKKKPNKRTNKKGSKDYKVTEAKDFFIIFVYFCTFKIIFCV